MTIPYIIEKGDKGQERTYDLYSRLLKDRIIFINGEFNDRMADTVVAQLLYLESADNEKDINLYINSPGGHITAMFSIFDTMTYIKPDISTFAYGMACSAGSFVLAAGTKGKRYALPNAQIMLHELSGGTQGKFHDMRNSFLHSEKLYEKMAEYYVDFTDQNLEKVKEDMKRDFYISSEEAKEYGVIDEVCKSR